MQVGKGTLLEAILPLILPLHKKRPSRALVFAALGPGSRARQDQPIEALQEQVTLDSNAHGCLCDNTSACCMSGSLILEKVQPGRPPVGARSIYFPANCVHLLSIMFHLCFTPPQGHSLNPASCRLMHLNMSMQLCALHDAHACMAQVLRLAEALFNGQQLAAIPLLLRIAGPAVDSPALLFLLASQSAQDLALEAWPMPDTPKALFILQLACSDTYLSRLWQGTCIQFLDWALVQADSPDVRVFI